MLWYCKAQQYYKESPPLDPIPNQIHLR